MNAQREMLIKLYTMFNVRDIDGVLACLHAHVEWPNGWEGGWLHGRGEVRDYWTRQWRELDPHVEPVGFETDEVGRVVVRVHAAIRDVTGRIVSDGYVNHIYSLVDGFVLKMEIQPIPS
jgi:SnoaL-like domain